MFREELLRVCPSISYEDGINYCGGEDIYQEILSDICHSGICEDIRTCFGSRDWENYRIQVHTLKNHAMTIGLMDLSEEAKSLEYALKDSDVDFVLANHEAIISKVEEVFNRLLSVLE